MKWNISSRLILFAAFLSCSDLLAASSFDIDACYYKNIAQATALWKGTFPVEVSDKVKENGLPAIVFPCKFQKTGDLCTWQKDFAVPVDISSYPYIYMHIYINNRAAFRDYALYFGAVKDLNSKQIAGWYAHTKRLSLQEGWNILTLRCDDFGKEGGVPSDGWKRIKTVRISFWGLENKSSAQITVKAIRACQVPKKNDINLTKSNGPLLDGPQVRIIPVPQSVEWTKEVFHCGKTDIPVVLTNNKPSQRVFDVIKADLADCTFQQKSALGAEGLVAVLGDYGKLSQAVLENVKKQLKLPAEGYYLATGKNYILLIGKDEPGFYYGFQTLRQIWTQTSAGVTVDGVKITDYPSLSMRGLYLHRMGTSAEALSKVKTVIKGLSAMKINMVFIDIASDMQYDKYPFPVTNSHPYTKAQMKELAAFARQHYVTICPYYQMFMHMPWIARDPRYRHLLEDPKQWNWYTSWCPSNPETYAFAESLISEAIEVFQPPYVHIGHDEMTFADPPLGTCKRCKGKSRESLIAESMNHLCDFIESKGVKTIVWDDTFNPWAHGLTPPKQLDGDRLINMVRRSLVINCWNYGSQKDEHLKQIHRFQEHKFKDIIISPKVNESNIRLTSELAKTNGLMGGIGTFWSEWGSFESYPDKISDKALPAIGMDAAYNWNPNCSLIPITRYDWNYRVRCFMEPNVSGFEVGMTYMPVVYPKVTDKRPPSDSELGKISLPDSIDFGFLPFRSISPIVLSGIKGETDYPVKVEIPVNQKATGLFFLHTLTEPFDRKKWEYYTNCTEKPEVGSYTVVYADNTKDVIHLNYRWNINSWNSYNGASGGFVAWQGANADGNLFRLYGLSWKNPKPQKTISKIEFSSAQEDGMNPVLLAITLGRKNTELR